MILQALVNYFNRKQAEKPEAMPPFGFEKSSVDYSIILDSDGSVIGVQPLSELVKYGKDNSKTKIVSQKRVVLKYALKKPKRKNDPIEIVPVRTSGTAAHFSYDNASYVLGIDSSLEEKKLKARRTWFAKVQHMVGDEIEDEGFQAFLKFIDSWNPNDPKGIDSLEELENKVILFSINSVSDLINERPKVKEAWLSFLKESKVAQKGICLISGMEAPISSTHSKIIGVKGTDKNRGSIVSFNIDSSESFGKKQNFNSPTSILSAFKYTTALNYLLSKDSNKNVQLGNTTTVFWAEKEDDMEYALPWVVSYNRQPGDLEEASDLELERFLKAMKAGKTPNNMGFNDDVKFYILGLVPNKARISVRFWFPTTVGKLRDNLRKHLEDVSIEGPRDYPPSIWVIINETLKKKKDENTGRMKVLEKMDTSPVIKLSGDLVTSIVTGKNYPSSLLWALLDRIKKDGDVSFTRLSMIKGLLIKNYHKEVTMSLNKENVEVPYLLGRLFAMLEKAQEDASGGGLNSTIKDKYFGSASATPRAVFPILFSLFAHWAKKGEHGGYHEKLIAEIMEDLPDERFSASMPLEDQGLFFIGYYHQRNDFFKNECESCNHRFSSWEAKEKIDEKASKKDHKIVACPNCGASVEVKAKKEKKSDKTETTEE